MKASRKPNWKSSSAGNPARVKVVKAKEEVEEVEIFQVVGDQGVEVDLVDIEGVMVDVGMSSIGDEVQMEVMVEALQDLLILRLVMAAKSEVIWPIIERKLET